MKFPKIKFENPFKKAYNNDDPLLLICSVVLSVIASLFALAVSVKILGIVLTVLIIVFILFCFVISKCVTKHED